ncbi:hypothetical protein SteCoe_22855 [Stentor coeruleus]|uniref:PIPK domain-containing protein n=1 Tax=Stentor coeruleus TaxID=5963 RepID=A0A1R2BLA0_9CILI|nr:hypothetical protein SteCoe_22855 [Stentor coeruleus]
MGTDYQVFIAVCIIASFGITINFFGLLAHIYVPVLLKHPGSLLFMHIFCQCVYMTHWFFLFPSKFENIPVDTCKKIAIYATIFFYASWIYILALCVEIYIILRFKAYSSSKIRIICYNISAFLFGACIMIIYYLLDSLGISEVGSCFVKIHTNGEILDGSLNFFLLGLLILSYYLVRKQLGCCFGPAFHKLSKVVLTMCVTIFISRITAITIYIQRGDSDHIAAYTIILGSSTCIIWGTSAAISRCFNQKVMSKIKECFQRKEKTEDLLLLDRSMESEEIMKSILSFAIDKEADDIADYIENLGHKILAQILVLLTIRFKDDNITTQNLNDVLRNPKRHVSLKYPESRFMTLSQELKMPFIIKIYCPDISLYEYHPEIFQCIKDSTDFTKDLILESLLSHTNLKALISINNGGGRSDSFFYMSANQKIVIKTITAEERISFMKFLPKYSKRIVEHPESKLVRILGLFQAQPHNQDFIIMENVIPNKNSCLIYDLKGSTVDRHVGGIDSENPPIGIVLKDVNFNRWGHSIKVQDPSEVIKHIVDDMKLLKKQKLMDYSILLGIYENPNELTRYFISNTHSICIIDFFQRYGMKKSLERFWKRYILRKTKGISAISSVRYFKRIVKYLKTIFEQTSNNEDARE